MRCLRGAGGPKTRPGRSARCSAAHGCAQARAAYTALGHLVGMQCMQAGPLVRFTRVWRRQRMIEGISGTERLLQVPERASKNNAGRHSCGSAEPACASTSCAHLHTVMCTGQKSFARLWEVASLVIVLYHPALPPCLNPHRLRSPVTCHPRTGSNF